MRTIAERRIWAEVLELKRRRNDQILFRRKIKNMIDLCVDRGDFDTLDKIQSAHPAFDLLCDAARRTMLHG